MTTLRDTETTHEVITIHGHDVSYRIAGDGPVILLVHGITGTSEIQRLVIARAISGVKIP